MSKELNKSDPESEPNSDDERRKKAKSGLHKGKKPPAVAQSINFPARALDNLPPLADKVRPVEEAKSEAFRDSPVQLVKINHDLGRFQVCEQGMRLLQGLEGNIGIVAFTGLYRTGKSFTLNLLLDKLGKGFEVDPTVNSCTQGIWIWGKPVYVKESNTSLLFIDTEGSGSTDRNDTHDSKIFALVVLICSYLIYNSVGVIDERAICNLSLAAELTKNIEMKLTAGKEKQEALANITPRFMWILKDFTLELLDEHGKTMTSNDYLEDSLNTSKLVERDGPGQSAIKIREAIIRLFRQRECMVFVRPVDDESLLRSLNSLKLGDMRPEFVKQFSLFKAKVFADCPIKMVNGKPVTGRMMSSLIEQYVKAINEGAVPNISTAWENVIDTEIRRAYDAAMKFYKEKTDQLATVSELPIEQDQLVTKLYQIRVECESIMGKSGRFSDADGAAKLIQNYTERLKSAYAAREEEIKAKNEKLSEELCCSKLNELALPLEKKAVENKYSIDNEGTKAMDQDVNEMLANYDKQARGPAKVRVLTQRMPKYMKKLMDSAARNNQEKFNKLDSDYKVRIMELEEKVGRDKQELERLQDMEKTARAKLANTESLMKAGKQNEETLSKEAEEARKEKEDIETQIAQLKEKIEKQNSDLGRLQDVEKDKEQIASETKKLKKKIDAQKSELERLQVTEKACQVKEQELQEKERAMEEQDQDRRRREKERELKDEQEKHVKKPEKKDNPGCGCHII